MGITAQRLKELKLIDNIVEEPLGGAHRDVEKMAKHLKARIKQDQYFHTAAALPIEKTAGSVMNLRALRL